MIDAETYEPPLPNDWVRPISLIAMLVIGAWNFAGWMMGDAPSALRILMGTLTITFEVVCFNASAQKSRADERDTSPAVRWFWLLALAMCCGWSVFSAHNALVLFTPGMSNLQRAPAYVVLVLAAFIIPMLPWAIERTERAPKKRPSESAHATVPPPSPERPPARTTVARRSKNSGRPYLHSVGQAALAVGAITTAMGAHAAILPAHLSDHADGAWRHQARDLWVGGMRNKSEIARQVGRPRESVRRELLALGA
jgi:hypothetical protein